MKVYLGDVSESRHRNPGELVAVTQTEAVGEVFLLQTALVDHGLQVPEHVNMGDIQLFSPYIIVTFNSDCS